jgi:hypothetical protein
VPELNEVVTDSVKLSNDNSFQRILHIDSLQVEKINENKKMWGASPTFHSRPQGPRSINNVMRRPKPRKGLRYYALAAQRHRRRIGFHADRRDHDRRSVEQHRA